MNLAFAAGVPLQYLLFSESIPWLNPCPEHVNLAYGIPGMVICTLSLVAYHCKPERAAEKQLQFAIDEHDEKRYTLEITGQR